MTAIQYRIIDDTVTGALAGLEALPEVFLEVLPALAAQELQAITPRSAKPPHMANEWRHGPAFLGNDAEYALAVVFRADRGSAEVEGRRVLIANRTAASLAVQTLNAVSLRAFEQALAIVLGD